MNLITQKIKLKEVLPHLIEPLVGEYDIGEDIELIRKGLTPDDLDVIEGERAIISYITTAAKDRDNEVILPEGAILRDYRKHPVVMFGHDYKSLPVGRNLWIKPDDKGLIAKTQYANTPEADKVYRYRADGFPLAESIGFIPLKWSRPSDDDWEEVLNAWKEKYKGIIILDERKKGGKDPDCIYTKWLLLEYSDVPIPSNPEALQLAISKGLIPGDVEIIEIEKDLAMKPYANEHACRLEEPGKYDRFARRNCEQKHDGKCIDVIYGIKEGKSEIQALRYNKEVWTADAARVHCRSRDGSFEAASSEANIEDVEVKGVIPYRDLGKADEGAEWDAGAEVREADVDDLKLMCAWFDSENPDIKTSYKLPHHKASGGHPAVWRGVAAAMGALLGARGGVQIPDGDRRGVYNHLSKHYNQFDKEPPEFRDYTEDEIKTIESLIDTFAQLEEIHKVGYIDWLDTILCLQGYAQDESVAIDTADMRQIVRDAFEQFKKEQTQEQEIELNIPDFLAAIRGKLR